MHSFRPYLQLDHRLPIIDKTPSKHPTMTFSSGMRRLLLPSSIKHMHQKKNHLSSRWRTPTTTHYDIWSLALWIVLLLLPVVPVSAFRPSAVSHFDNWPRSSSFLQRHGPGVVVLYRAPGGVLSWCYKKGCLYVNRESCESSSLATNNDDFAQFVDRQLLRDIVKNTPVFQDLNRVELETIVQTFEPVQYDDPNDDFVFREGDQGDGMYIVKSGSVDMVSKDQQIVFSSYTSGGLFGELALLFDEPRAASARVAENGTELWKLSKKDFNDIIQYTANNVPAKAKESVVRDPKYAEYLNKVAVKSAMQQCPIFRGFESQDLERCVENMEIVTYMNGDVIIQQGDLGNAMYFVKSGIVTCVDEKSGGRVVAEIQVGGYFGELALLFNKPRAVTVRATEDNVAVWRLSAEKFFEAVQEYSLSEKTLELLQEKYAEASLWSILQKASLEEIFDLIRNASRPKKKNVTIHSIVSSIYVGLFLVAYLPQFHPTMHNVVGSPQLFSPFDLSDATVLQYRLGSFMAVVVSLLGVFRISKNAPDCRRNYFTAMLWASAAMWSFGDSNIGGATTGYTFDVFTPFGAGFIGLTHLIGACWMLKGIDDAITGPMKGRETLPLVRNRWSGVFVHALIFCFFYTNMDVVVWSNYDSQGYQEIALPFYQTGYDRFALVAGFTFTGVQAFGAFFGTLLFEKKISEVTATFLNFLLFSLTFGDQVASFWIDTSTPQYQAVVPLYEWIAQYRQEFHTPWIVGSILLLTIANALCRRTSLGVTD